MIAHWRRRGQWERLQCIELLWVRGWSNKEVAARLGISEQTVANYKFETIARLRLPFAAKGCRRRFSRSCTSRMNRNPNLESEFRYGNRSQEACRES